MYLNKAKLLKKEIMKSKSKSVTLIMNWDNCKSAFTEVGLNWSQEKDYLKVWLNEI